MQRLADQGAGAAWLALLATTCLSACPPPLPAARCGGDAKCPAGSRCDDELGVCVAWNARCGTVGAFVDDFDDGVPSTDWAFCNDTDNAPILHQDGAMAIAFDASGQGSGGSVCRSFLAAALQDEMIWVEVPSATDTAAASEAFFEVGTDGDLISIYQRDSQLNFEIWSGNDQLSSAIPYDPQAHRWWALREQEGRVSFETSTDGRSWISHADLPTPAVAARATLALGAWSNDLGRAPGTVVFDNLNAGHAPVGFCAAHGLQDPLTGPELHAEWQVTEGDGCQASSTDQGLELSTPLASDFVCALATASGYSLEDSEVLVEIPEGGQVGTIIGITIWSPHGTILGLWFYDGQVGGWIVEENDGPVTYSFDGGSADLRWLRVREAADLITFEGRVGATDAWSALGSSSVAVDFERVVVRLVLMHDADAIDPPAQPARALFRNYNLP